MYHSRCNIKTLHVGDSCRLTGERKQSKKKKEKMEKMERTIPRTDRECTLNHAYQSVFHLYCKNFNKRLFFLLIKYITRCCSFIIFILLSEDRFSSIEDDSLELKILIKYNTKKYCFLFTTYPFVWINFYGLKLDFVV